METIKKTTMTDFVTFSKFDLENFKEAKCYEYQAGHSLNRLQEIANPLHNIVVACNIIELVVDKAINHLEWQQTLKTYSLDELFHVARNPVIISCYDSRYVNPVWEDSIMEYMEDILAR